MGCYPYKEATEFLEDPGKLALISSSLMEKRANACCEIYSLLGDLLTAAVIKEEDWLKMNVEEELKEGLHGVLKEAKEHLNRAAESLK